MGILDFFGGGSDKPTVDPSMAAMRDLGMPQSLIDAYGAEQEKNRKMQAMQMIVGGIGNALSGYQGMAPVAAPNLGGSGGAGGGDISGSMDGLLDRAMKFSQLRENVSKREQAAAARAALPELARQLGIDPKLAAGMIDQLPAMMKSRQDADFNAQAEVRRLQETAKAAGITDPAEIQKLIQRQFQQNPKIDKITLPNGQELSVQISPDGTVRDLGGNTLPPELVRGADAKPKLGPVFGGEEGGYYAVDPQSQKPVTLVPGQPKPGPIFGGDKSGYYTLDRKTQQPNLLVPGQQSIGVSEDVYKAEAGLRGEVHDRSKDFGNRQTAFMTMEDLAKQGEGASDIALVISLMKVYDPTSTVTGQEAANAQNAAGVPGWLRSKYNTLLGEGKLDQQSRQELVNAGRLRFDQELDNHGKTIEYYRDLATKYRLDPERVVQDVRDQRLMGERDSRKVQSIAPSNILQMNYQQLMQLEKQASKMTPEQLRAAVARKAALGGGGR